MLHPRVTTDLSPHRLVRSLQYYLLLCYLLFQLLHRPVWIVGNLVVIITSNFSIRVAYVHVFASVKYQWKTPSVCF